MQVVTYSDLRQRVKDAGLLERSGWKSLPLALIAVALGAIALAVAIVAPGPWSLIAAPLLAVFWMQLGFVGHDTGHNQVFPRTQNNQALGLFCFPLLLGMCFRPWVIKHNLHHAETNVLDADPDIDHPLLAFTEEAARARRGVARWIVRYQAYLYLALAMFTTLAFRVDAWRYALKLSEPAQNSTRYAGERKIELLLLIANAVVWVAIPVLLLGAARWLPIFVLGQLLLGVNMAFVFAPNHKGMPIFTEETRLTFVEQQVLTSRNVYGGPIVDFLYGGLNYQIEHHLFPTMPRQNFAACQKIVKAYCHDVGLAHAEESVIGSCKSLFTALDDIGKLALLPAPTSEGSLVH